MNDYKGIVRRKEKNRCMAITASGKQCMRKPLDGEWLCSIHKAAFDNNFDIWNREIMAQAEKLWDDGDEPVVELLTNALIDKIKAEVVDMGEAQSVDEFAQQLRNKIREDIHKLVTGIRERVEGKDTATFRRRTRPEDAANILPLEKSIRLWTQTHLTGLVLDVTTSTPDAWKHIPKMNGYALETAHGKALIENIGTWENLRKILDMLGPEGLQYTLASLAHIEDVTRRKFGGLPDAITGVTPVRIACTDLLRSMGRKPDGNTYSREQQLRPRRFLKAQSMVEYLDIEPTKNGRTKMRIGPLINILNTEVEATLPFEDIPDDGEVVSVLVMPGEAVYQLMRKGIRWCHPQLLKYDSKLKYEIAIGFYLGQLATNRRNKLDQEYVAIGSIERGSGVESYDKANVRRRLSRIIDALNRLAQDGVIPGQLDSAGKITAIFQTPQSSQKLDAVESKRAMKVKVVHPDALPNGYIPLPCTANQP